MNCVPRLFAAGLARSAGLVAHRAIFGTQACATTCHQHVISQILANRMSKGLFAVPAILGFVVRHWAMVQVLRCQELNGELLPPLSALRVALAVYRADDDEGPDEP